MKKFNHLILLTILICMTLASCSNSSIDSINIENGELSYDGKIYISVDDEGRNLSSSWIIDKAYETEKIKGIINYNGVKSTITVQKFKNENLKMFLFDDDFLYCEKGYTLPDYRKNSDIEKIIIIPNANVYPDEANSIVIENQEDIKTITENLIKISDYTNYNKSNNSATKKPQTSDSDIEIVYSNCPAIFYYGCISINSNNEYGIYCSDVNCGNSLYTVNSELLNVLNKYGTCYQEP